MKKFLFLLLGLAVSVSAVAGAQKHQTIGGTQMSMNKVMSVAKHNTAATVQNLGTSQMIQKLVSDKNQVTFQTARQMEMREATLKAIVTETPAGTPKTYMRTAGTAAYRGSNGITTGNQSGYVQAVEDGNTIWFKNLLYDPNGYMGNYWVYGTKVGNTVQVPLGQEVAWSSQYQAYIVLAYGYVYIDDGYVVANWDDTKTYVTYNIEGDVLKLQDTEHDASADYPSYSGWGFCLRWTDDDSFSAPAEWNTELTLEADIVIPDAPTVITDDDVLAMTGGSLIGYWRDGGTIYPQSSSLVLDNQGGIAYIYFDADGSTVYMRDPIYYLDLGTWVKGTVSGNKITIPLGQYLYYDESSFIGAVTGWGEFVDGTGFNPLTADNVTYTIDGNKIVMDNTSEYVGLAWYRDSALTNPAWNGALDFNTVYTVVPDEPTDVAVQNVKTTSAQVTWTEPGDAESWIVRYRVHPEFVNLFYDLNDQDEWPEIWIRDNDGDGDNWGATYIDDANSDIVFFSYSAAFNDAGTYTGGLTPDNWLMIPFEKMEGTFSLAAWSMNASWPDNFGIFAAAGDASSVPSVDQFVQVGEDVVASTEKTTYEYDVKGAGFEGPGWIAVRHYNSDDMVGLIVDDFGMNYEGAGEIGEWVVDTVTTIPYTIQPLQPGTRYEVDVTGIHGDVLSWISESVYFTTPLTDPFLRGDVNDDGDVNITDVITLITAVLSDNFEGINDINANVNYDEDLNITDVIQLINFVSSGHWYDE